MTKSECYSQIALCNAEIEEDRRKISSLEEKIALYEQIYRRVERGQENMGDFCSAHSRKINRTIGGIPRPKKVLKYR